VPANSAIRIADICNEDPARLAQQKGPPIED